MSRKKILALILAGGAGSRLDVLTEERAKPAMPFGGVYRLIDFALSNCMHSGISDVWVAEQYRPHSLDEHLANGRPWDLDRTYGGLQVLPPYEKRGGEENEGGFAEGNADAIYRNRTFIREFDPDLLLVLSADHLYKLDYAEVVDQHVERQAEVTLVTTRVSREEASRFGVVQVDGQGRVIDFAYKPDEPQSDLVTTEVFVYNAQTLMETLDELAGEGEDGASLKDFGHELLPRLVQEGKAFEYRFDRYWRDVGTVASYWKAHQDLLAPEPELALDDPKWPIFTFGSQRVPARIYTSARIDNSLISPGCRIHGQVIRSVLAPDVVVEEGAVVRDSILLQGTLVRSNALIDCAVLDSGAVIEEAAVVGRQVRTETPADGDITLVGRKARIPRQGRVPAGARIKPGEAFT